MNADKDQVTVLTVRCIDMAPPLHEVDKIPCSECGEMTWISKSFKEKKIDKITCTKCFYDGDVYKSGDYSANVTEETVEEVIKYIRSRFEIKKTDE